MPKLSDTQLVILSKASQRDDRVALPLPAGLKGGAAQKVVASLLSKGLLEEVEAKRGQRAWRESNDGATTLVVTDAGLGALNIGPEASPSEAVTSAGSSAKRKRADRQSANAKPKARTRKGAETRAVRTDTKQAALIGMLKRAKGATIEEIAEALDWQHHTVRGAIAGALKKKLGLKVLSEKSEKRGRIYKIED
jgi:hypothetical protein